MEWLTRFNLVDVGAVLIFSVFWIWILVKNRDRADTYDLSDNIKDAYTNKASASALVYLSLAGLSIWWVVRSATGGADPSSFLLGVLGIFIAKGTADRVVSAWGDRKPDMAPPPEGTPVAVDQPDVNVTVDSPAEITTKTTVKKTGAGK